MKYFQISATRWAVVLAVPAVLAACVYGGTYNYRGPGTFQDFAKTRYQCLQEVGTRKQAGGMANQYGASYAATEAPSCSALDACLASRGYYRDPNGPFDAEPIKINCVQ